MALLATQQIKIAGTEPAYTAAAGGGDTVVSDDRTFLHVKNGSGDSVTVTIATPGLVGGLAIADATVAIPAGDEFAIGPITRELFGSIAAVTYSSATTVTVAALRV